VGRNVVLTLVNKDTIPGLNVCVETQIRSP